MDREEIQHVLDAASELLEAGKPEETLACLDRLDNAACEGDDRAEWAALRAWALSELGRIDEALDTLGPVLREFPEAARLHAALGVVLSNDGNLEEACEELELAISLDERDDVAIANLGLVYERLREYERAISLYDHALELGVELDWLLQRKAIVHAELGDYESAKAVLKRYLSLAPGDVEQWITLALFHAEDEQYDEALACYRRGEELDPELPALRLHFGATALEAGCLDVARGQLRHLQRIDPHGAGAKLLRAMITEESAGNAGAAKHYLDAVRRINFADFNDVSYTLDRAMDFFARQQDRPRCDELLALAYKVNACTVELCEAYRQSGPVAAESVVWYSVLVEADYRLGLVEVPDRRGPRGKPPTRFWRNVQFLAADRDDAIAGVTDLLTRHGETNVRVREFVSEEPLERGHYGVYEIERESFVFVDEPGGAE